MLGIKHGMIHSSLGNKSFGRNYIGAKQSPYSVTGSVRTNHGTPIGDNQYTKDTIYMPTGVNRRRTKGINPSLEKNK